MAYARDAETLGLLFKALAQHRCPTVALLARRLGVPSGPPLLVAIGVDDNPHSRWDEIEGPVGRLRLSARAGEPPRVCGTTWEEMTAGEREDWLRAAQAAPAARQGS